MKPEQIDTFADVSERLNKGRPFRAIGQIALSTLAYATPQDERLYLILKDGMQDRQDTALNKSVEETNINIRNILNAENPDVQSPQLNTEQLSWFVNTMYQFGNKNGLSAEMSTPHPIIKNIHDEIVSEGLVSPINLDEQLKIALDNSPNLTSAVWNLFLTSRHYARWHDEDCINGSPDISSEEKLELMKEWELSLSAIKPSSPQNGHQDSAGDTYYVWTHALAKIIYSHLPRKKNLLTKFYETSFKYGSHAMNSTRILGAVGLSAVVSSHLPASYYGNSIGDTFVDYMRNE